MIATRRQSLRELLNFLPKQQAAWEAVKTHTYTLYGGAAGGGKSRFLRWCALGLLIQWGGKGFKGVRVGLFSQDYPTLHDRQLSKIREEFPDWLGTFNESAREFRLSPLYGGGVICFRNLDDPSKYKSAEFAAILVEELTENEESVFEALRWRLRWPGIEDTKFIGATNPNGVGHLWVKLLWILREFPEELRPYADQFAYIKATVLDNPYNPASYLEKLKSLPSRLRMALLDGSWDAFEGQMFTSFRADFHTIEPFSIPHWWKLWGSNDPGYNDAGTWYIHAADEQGNIYTVREWYWQGQSLEYSAQAKKVREDCDQLGWKPQLWVTGMDATVTHPETGKAMVDYYREGGLWPFVEPDHGSGSRARMAATVHEYLRPFPDPAVQDGEEPRETSRWKIFRTCKKLIQTLPTLPVDPDDLEAVDDCASDHWYQGCGYGLQWWHARKSTAPEKEKYKAGTAGDILKHAEKLGEVKQTPKAKVFG